MAEAENVKMEADDGTYDQACASTSNVLPTSHAIPNTAYDDRSDDDDDFRTTVDPKYAALLKHCSYVDPDDDTSDGTLGASSTDSDSWDDTYKQRSMNFRSYDGLPRANTRRQWQQDDIEVGAGAKIDATPREINKKPARKTKE